MTPEDWHIRSSLFLQHEECMDSWTDVKCWRWDEEKGIDFNIRTP
jgi:hypothetical protein